MNTQLQSAIARLSSIQRSAADWNDGPALVLAGPGVGKTTVLTVRLARILEESRGKNFRILALTFTTKAADEMRTRVEELVPGLTERTLIGTFHSFCSQILRQHGSHIGIQGTFGVYDQDADREELLREALVSAAKGGADVTAGDVRWLKAIDSLRANLVDSSRAAKEFQDSAAGAKAAQVMKIYEQALRDNNVMDFGGMILETCLLAHKVPAVAARIRQSYPYWMLDEFQDTSPAQYRLIKFLAGDDFRNVFVVADDDQIIYQWAGASYKQIVSFREHFKPQLFQLVENRRCPAEVVEAANELIQKNSDRTPGKDALVATRTKTSPSIELRSFDTEMDEARGIAAEILASETKTWGATAVIGRTRATLEPILKELQAAGVKAALATKRDKFISPQFAWLLACLDQSVRPLDRQVFVKMVGAANRFAGTEIDASLVQAQAEGSGRTMFEQWTLLAQGETSPVSQKLGALSARLIQSRAAWKPVTAEALKWLPETDPSDDGVVSDVADDKAAWETAARAIRSERGGEIDLPDLLQGIALRPKEPPADKDTVYLYTIHAAKGLEFDHVWVAGLAEGILPSWQSLRADANPTQLEEERRSCFVAITRTRKTLVLTRANVYHGFTKAPSRFLKEMALTD